jgi:hypothetical protein
MTFGRSSTGVVPAIVVFLLFPEREQTYRDEALERRIGDGDFVGDMVDAFIFFCSFRYRFGYRTN